jgi:hypothetical protein
MGGNDRKIVVADQIFDLDEQKQRSLSEYHVFVRDLEMSSDELNDFKTDLITLPGELSIFFHIRNDDGEERIIKATEIKAPKGDEFCRMFEEKYSFIEKIRVR